jgi:hypothetical protein
MWSSLMLRDRHGQVMSQSTYERLLSMKVPYVWKHSLLARARTCPILRSATRTVLEQVDPLRHRPWDKRVCGLVQGVLIEEERLRPPEEHRDGLRVLGFRVFREWAGLAFGVRFTGVVWPYDAIAQAALKLLESLPWELPADAWVVEFLKGIEGCPEMAPKTQEWARQLSSTKGVSSQGSTPTDRLFVSEDGRQVIWKKQSYSLSPLQAVVVRALYEALMSGAPVLSHAALLERAESKGKRLRDLFKYDDGRKLWGTLIAIFPRVKKGLASLTP